MARGLSDLFTLLTTWLPMEWVIAVLSVGAVVALPFWIGSMRDKQVRGLVRQMVRAGPGRREDLIRQARTLVGHKRARLYTLVDQAIRYDQPGLRDEGIARLVEIGAHEDVAAFRRRFERAKPVFRDPVEAVVRVERLLEDTLFVAAKEQLALALAQFPDEPDLTALLGRFPQGDEQSG